MVNSVETGGVVQILVNDSVLYGIDAVFNIIVEQLVDLKKLTIYWADDGTALSYFPELARKIETATKYHEVLDEDWAKSSINSIQYVESLDLNSILKLINRLINNKTLNTLLVLLNVKELFQSSKLDSFNETHGLVNEIMHKVRKLVDSGANSAILLDIDDHDSNFIDFFIDKRYKLGKKEIYELT